MLRVTRLTDYATLLLSLLAMQPKAVHSATLLAERTRLEPSTVSKVLKILGQADLVESRRGVNGGYRLARDAGDISLLEIVEAIEGPVELTECSGPNSRCELQDHCWLAPRWRQINDIIAETLAATSLAQMLGTTPLVADARPNPSLTGTRA